MKVANNLQINAMNTLRPRARSVSRRSVSEARIAVSKDVDRFQVCAIGLMVMKLSHDQKLLLEVRSAFADQTCTCIYLHNMLVGPVLDSPNCASSLYCAPPHMQVYRRINRKNEYLIPLYWDVTVYNNAAATTIQRYWRGTAKRNTLYPILVQLILKQRGAIAIQRWWRHITGLHRRLVLLSKIANVCRRIEAPVLYCDMWVYYQLLRCPTITTIVAPSMRYFPETLADIALSKTRDDFVCVSSKPQLEEVAHCDSVSSAHTFGAMNDSSCEVEVGAGETLSRNGRRHGRNGMAVAAVRFPIPHTDPHSYRDISSNGQIEGSLSGKPLSHLTPQLQPTGRDAHASVPVNIKPHKEYDRVEDIEDGVREGRARVYR